MDRLSKDDIKHIASAVIRQWRFWISILVAIGTIIPAAIMTLVKPKIENQIAVYQSNAVQALNRKIDLSITNNERAMTVQFTSMQESLHAVKTNFEREVDVTFHEVTNRLGAEFQTPRITHIVEDVASRHATSLMARVIGPELGTFTNNLAKLSSEAQTNIANLRETTEFALLLTKASNDDRRAYDELVRLRESPVIWIQETARVMVSQIVSKLAHEAQNRNGMIDYWNGTTNSASKATIGDFKIRYSELASMQRMYLIHDLFLQTRLPLHGRLQFFVDVARLDPSLQCAYQAIYCLNQEAKLNLTLLGLPRYLEWWETNKMKYADGKSAGN